jgi:phosphoglycolate phosphatase-like HAD superfamily hydrolase
MYTILFDLDGVLLNSSAIHEESFKSSFADHNLEFRFDYKDIAGLSTKDAIYKILKNKEMKNETISSLISTKQEYAKKLFSELKSVPVFPGVVKGLNMLQEFYTMALCTSASQATVDFFFRSPIKKEWFDFRNYNYFFYNYWNNIFSEIFFRKSFKFVKFFNFNHNIFKSIFTMYNDII